MKPTFEESTKIHSASELDEMLRKASANVEADDEHTMIGDSEELAARSMSVPDHQPAPRASNNIIRRTGPSPVVAPPASQGTQPDFVDEDDAFAPWEDEAQRTSPQDANVAALREVPLAGSETPPAIETSELEQPELPEVLDHRLPAHVVARPALESRMPIPIDVRPMMPAYIARVAAPATVASPISTATMRRFRTLAIVSTIVFVVMIGVVAAGYRRILKLEDELAATRAALDAATLTTPLPAK